MNVPWLCVCVSLLLASRVPGYIQVHSYRIRPNRNDAMAVITKATRKAKTAMLSRWECGKQRCGSIRRQRLHTAPLHIAAQARKRYARTSRIETHCCPTVQCNSQHSSGLLFLQSNWIDRYRYYEYIATAIIRSVCVCGSALADIAHKWLSPAICVCAFALCHTNGGQRFGVFTALQTRLRFAAKAEHIAFNKITKAPINALNNRYGQDPAGTKLAAFVCD